MIKAVIFDVDGTLVDSNDLHLEAWRAAFRCYGKELSCEELEQKRVGLFKSDYLPRVQPFPRVRELFERVKADGLQIARASSAKEDDLERHKKSMGVEDLLEAATSADDAERSKPHPDIFQEASAGLNGVRPGEAVVVGDTPDDVQGAAKAGMSTVGLLSGGFLEGVLCAACAVTVFRDVSDLLDSYEKSPLARARADAAEVPG